MREPWRAGRQRRLGGKDGEAFGTPVYSAAPRSASKDGKINVPVPWYVGFILKKLIQSASCENGMSLAVFL